MTTKPEKKRRFNLPLALTLGGMITLGITTTTLGFVLWPEPKSHVDKSTEGWPKEGPRWNTRPTAPAPPVTTTTTPPVAAAHPPMPDAGAGDAGE